jgi:hypothetical protein
VTSDWDLAWEAVNRRGAMQRVGELAEVITLVRAELPGLRTVLEVGCHVGGTLWVWSQLGAERIWGITAPVPGPQALHLVAGSEVLWSDSHDPAARLWAEGEAGVYGCLDLLFIDGDHAGDGARRDWEDYGPLVRPGGLILVHDVAHDDLTPDVVAFWAEIEAAWPAQARVITGSPGGLDEPAGFGIVTVTEEMFKDG